MRKSLFAGWVGCFGFCFLTCFHAEADERPRPWLSEVLANPEGVPDEEAEFIEICGDPSQPTPLSGLEIHFESRVYHFPSLILPPGGAYVLCRDSAAASALGMPCSGHWSGLQLANARSLWFVLRDSIGHLADYVVPVTRAGESLENGAGEISPGGSHATQLPVFSPSLTPFITGFASPGRCGTAHRGEGLRAQSGEASPPTTSPTTPLPMPWGGESQPDVKTLREPALRVTRLSLQNPNDFPVAVPTGFAKGEWRLSDRGGRVMLTGKLPEKAAVMGLLESAHGGGGDLHAVAARLRPGPYILTLAKGRKRWLAVISVIP